MTLNFGLLIGNKRGTKYNLFRHASTTWRFILTCVNSHMFGKLSSFRKHLAAYFTHSLLSVHSLKLYKVISFYSCLAYLSHSFNLSGNCMTFGKRLAAKVIHSHSFTTHPFFSKMNSPYLFTKTISCPSTPRIF